MKASLVCCVLASLLCGCNGITSQTFILPDGTTHIALDAYREDGFMSTDTVTVYHCDPKCTTMFAGVTSGGLSSTVLAGALGIAANSVIPSTNVNVGK